MPSSACSRSGVRARPVRRRRRGALELLAVPFATAITNAWRLEETSQQALSDPMTGLANRAYALHELERSLARQHRHGGHTAVIFVDLDRFKAVNDTWGHAAGDELLSVVADQLRQAVRTTDTPARYGGDEFVIVCEGLTAARGCLGVGRAAGQRDPRHLRAGERSRHDRGQRRGCGRRSSRFPPRSCCGWRTRRCTRPSRPAARATASVPSPDPALNYRQVARVLACLSARRASCEVSRSGGWRRCSR